MKKLAIITTHPIQYNAPLFQLLNSRAKIQIKVFYTWGEDGLKNKFDPGFGKNIEWDIPLLDGYDNKFEINTASDKGSHHFNGIDNPDLIRDICSWGADALLVYGWSFKSHLKAIRYFHKKIPVYFRGDSTVLRKSPTIKKIIRSIFLRWVYKHIDKVFYVGTYNKNYYEAFGVKPHNLVFAPHAIDNDRFKIESAFGKEYSNQWKNEIGIPADNIVFLYAGKFDNNKNTLLLIEAFIASDLKDSSLLLAGNGVLEKSITDRIRHIGNIFLIPFQNQQKMPTLYMLADVFVLPSIAETWGLGINEAMACGKAILASDGCAAARDLVEEAVNGYIFEKTNKGDAVAKITALASDRKRLIRFGERSSEIIRNWSLVKVCQAIEQQMESIS